MLKTQFIPYQLIFKKPSGTSRGVLTTKETWFVKIWNEETPELFGLGECALFRGLGCDDQPDYETVLQSLSPDLPPLEELQTRLKDFPSILFGIETALWDLQNGGNRIIHPSAFSEGEDYIRINGLIWMGTKEEMRAQIIEKLEKGFSCIKLKIGAIDFEAEMDLLQSIRKEFSADRIELRVDANGAFSPEDALHKLERLSKLNLHSIEQPIKAEQWEAMAHLCEQTPLPIALDEELIGINNPERKALLLDTIKPQYIILKPSLHGAFIGSSEWIDLANERGINWWITSALESNVGLNAIAQWCYTLQNPMPQGLGTGLLYTNNFPSPLTLEGEQLFYKKENLWDLSLLTAHK
ncbi:o-succinylbenzoate synthase [Parabacteroides sp. FAFU027]|uniref:o-succinylbenzoate synthase n=1 Tax=Parabacteroides sp. FAFU027 TaxID=2922715 RepID=UPI001FAF1D0A|nr:o-succinylbenzoate synthase [Parabacteroides sp. FAFU027]